MSEDHARVACPACGRRFSVAADALPAAPEGSRARCRGCGASFLVRRAGAGLTVEAAPAAPAAPVPAAPRPRAGGRRAAAEPTGPGRRRRPGPTAASPSPDPRAEPLPPSGEGGTPFGLGDRIGRYEIEAVLARGGMGSIYKVYDPAANRHVALKVLGTHATDLDRLRFQREIQVQGNIQHPHIMPIFDSGVIGTARYYTMELLKDPLDLLTLADLARSGEASRDPKLRPIATLEGLVREVVLPVCGAVHHANVNEGVLHRDVKPGNILVDRNGLRPFLIDFGVSALLEKKNARLAHLDRELPVPLSGKGIHITGTLVFMPPEQARGRADRRGDVWALGAVLHYLVTGDPPIEPAIRPVVSREDRAEGLRLLIEQAQAEGNAEELEEFAAKLRALQSGRERTVDDLRRDVLRGRYKLRPPTVPKGLEAIIRKAMNPNPEVRYRHALELQEDLKAWLEGRPVRAIARDAGRAGGLLYRGRLLLRRHWRMTAVFVLLAALAVAAYAWRPQERAVDRTAEAAQRLADGMRLEQQGERDEARRAAREALRLHADTPAAFDFLRRLDDRDRLARDVARARQLRDEAETALAAGDAAVALRRQAALEEVLVTALLPALSDADGAGLHGEMQTLLRFARGEQAFRVRGAPPGSRFHLVPVEPGGGRIAWGRAEDVPAGDDGADPDAVVTPGAWVLRITRGTGEVLVPFAVDAIGRQVEVACPVDPALLDEDTIYVGAGRPVHAPGVPQSVPALLWDRTEVTQERYARFLASLPADEQRRRVPRLAGSLGASDQPLWDGVGTGFQTPGGALRRPLEGVSLYDARAFARFEGKRLPTASEWAWAATGPDGRLCPVGRARDLGGGATRVDLPLAGVADGLASPADRSPFGLYDMAGNLAEFTSTLGALRGETGWFVMGASYLTPAARALVNDARIVPGWQALQGVGFRCVRDVPASGPAGPR